MKRSLKKILAKLFEPLARKLGFVLKEKATLKVSQKNNLLFNFYSILKNIGFDPKHIVDVGANHGTWTREAMKFFPDAYYTLLEPQEGMRNSVKDLLEHNEKVSFNQVGAGSEEGSFKFTIADRDDSCSFIYSEEEAKKMGFAQIEVPIVTLNSFLIEKKLPSPDIIKIDAEGLDLEVLKGASEFFGSTELFLVEAAVVNDRVDNDIFEVMSFMKEKGYKLFDITDLNRPHRHKVLWLVELVFIKKGGYIDNQSFK